MVQQVPELTMPVVTAPPWAVTVLDWPEEAAEAETLAATGALRLQLVAPDVAPPVDWDLTSDWLKPLQGILPSAIVAPSTPAQLPFTDVGPQSFAFDNAIVWTQPLGTSTSLRPFPTSLQTLQAAQGTAISMLVESREGGAPYLPVKFALAAVASWIAVGILGIRARRTSVEQSR